MTLCMVLVGTSEYVFPAESLDFLNSKIKLTEDAISAQLATRGWLSENLTSDTQLDEYNKVNDTISDLYKQLGILKSLRSGNPQFINPIHAQKNSYGNRFIVIGSGLIVASACLGLGVTKMYNPTFDGPETENFAHKIVDGSRVAIATGLAATLIGFGLKGYI